MTTDFTGSGWAFPLAMTAGGTFDIATGTRKLEQSMRLILSTYLGERPMRPNFGCRLRDFVFAEATMANTAAVSAEVRDALKRCEPRVDVADVNVYADDNERGLLYIDIDYTVKASYDRRSLVFPFYTIPEHEE
ncbi:MAG TPA: GPW/gp25 family protein [Pseudonocardiaceae bacterium]|nr:GPW/gp25 family protein [Pseudonocardiaceae bacterium]